MLMDSVIQPSLTLITEVVEGENPLFLLSSCLFFGPFEVLIVTLMDGPGRALPRLLQWKTKASFKNEN